MADPSDYELSAWRGIQRFKGRPLSRVTGNASAKVAVGAAEIGQRATKYIENHPRTRSAVRMGRKLPPRARTQSAPGPAKPPAPSPTA